MAVSEIIHSEWVIGGSWGLPVVTQVANSKMETGHRDLGFMSIMLVHHATPTQASGTGLIVSPEYWVPSLHKDVWVHMGYKEQSNLFQLVLRAAVNFHSMQRQREPWTRKHALDLAGSSEIWRSTTIISDISYSNGIVQFWLQRKAGPNPHCIWDQKYLFKHSKNSTLYKIHFIRVEY